jgi:hypothetical protein
VCLPITGLFLVAIDYPYNPFPTQFPDNEWPAPDLSLQAGSKAEDVGTVIANINEFSDDDYTGAAPDAGAYEVGAQPPEYGPR